MDASRIIRDEVGRVQRFRAVAAGRTSLAESVSAVKRIQSLRFEFSYHDLLRGGPYQGASHFFMSELYGPQDYSRRDEQFARIAGAIQTLLPMHAVATAVTLARLHGLTEQLDLSMGEAWERDRQSDTDDWGRYVRAWRQTAREVDRYQQLRLVLEVGADLDALTRTPGLRLILKMMRGPAQAAGLPDLQYFLERGFDTFASIGKRKLGSARDFLKTVESRETEVIQALFTPDYEQCQTAFKQLLELPAAIDQRDGPNNRAAKAKRAPKKTPNG
jgi:hypothetical protein